MRGVMALLACGLALSGCASGERQEPLPANYRQLIADYARSQFYFDPYSLRDVSISTTIGTDVSLYGPVQTVCVRANAKNRLGGYIGIKATQFSLREGRVVGAFQDRYGIGCGRDTTFEPFPELEGKAAPKS